MKTVKQIVRAFVCIAVPKIVTEAVVRALYTAFQDELDAYVKHVLL